MIDQLLSYLAPHHCYGCGKIDTLLCDNCKYNIIDDMESGCITCGITTADNGICMRCSPPYERAWHVGERNGELRELIDGLKFKNERAAAKVLAQLLDEKVNQLPSSTIVVPIPTIMPHIRTRGYDQTLLIARYFAKKRNHALQPIVIRTTNTVQRGMGRRERLRQAEAAFTVKGEINANIPYLLIDDVVTTGATLQYAARALRQAGATTVWVAAIARQPLD